MFNTSIILLIITTKACWQVIAKATDNRKQWYGHKKLWSTYISGIITDSSEIPTANWDYQPWCNKSCQLVANWLWQWPITGSGNATTKTKDPNSNGKSGIFNHAQLKNCPRAIVTMTDNWKQQYQCFGCQSYYLSMSMSILNLYSALSWSIFNVLGTIVSRKENHL